MATMARTSAPCVTGEIRFRREGDELHVERATPVMWFASHVLANLGRNPDIGLTFDGRVVTLQAPNGRWVWRLTGRSVCVDNAVEGDQWEMLEGVWPD
ncbi:hypothetical protein [Mycobacterium sp. PSTR-4-N]|uniref:hypothetical protein n=1 Tax=Mycobacterium sp. PSTR-4-N TaxID=2917745 RepID=UPI001F154976|nr:hypothetical protein [Mycobacterium sp. PSTR-4-N]MCG7595230.1 hypothetical protein [Mycobacterium sp. PSTR-4-N]